MFRRIVALTLTLLLLLPVLSGCSGMNNKYLSVGISACSQVFSPFFATSEGDLAVVDLLFDNLLTTERGGQVILDGIDGETVAYKGVEYTYTGPADVSIIQDEAYGTTTVTITLRDNMTFSDGLPVTADDLLFTYYVLCDSNYEGYSKVKELDIVGLQNYQTQTPVTVYEKYLKRAESLYKEGWPDAIGSDMNNEADWFWYILKKNWQQDIYDNIEYCVNKYRSFSEEYIGFTAEEVADSTGLQTALGMVIWNFAKVDDGVLTTTVSEKTFDLNAGEYPTADVFFEETFIKYEGDVEAYSKEESANTTDILNVTKQAFVQHWGPQDEIVEDVDCSYITGIRKLSDSSIAVTLDSLKRQDLATLLNVYIAPLHYYGSKSFFNAEENQHGFTRGELEPLHTRDAVPLGSGAYTLQEYKNNTAELAASTTYWRGTPTIATVHLAEVSEIDRISDIANGVLDITTVSGANNALAAVTTYNIAEKLSGSVITTHTTAADPLEYIGLNTKALAIGEADSAASGHLRNALVTLLIDSRAHIVTDTIGLSGSVISSPVSFDSALVNAQATPATDPISDTVQNSSYETALEAALSYLRSADYTIDEENKVSAAPEGGRTTFSAVCLADSESSPSPARKMLEQLKTTMDTIGLTLTITVAETQEALDEALESGKYHLFADTWSYDTAMDLTARFSSDGAENHFDYENGTLDELLAEADALWQVSAAQTHYSQALEIITQAHVVVPVCQMQNAILYNTERLASSGIPENMTRHWNWTDAIASMQLSQ